MEALRTPPSVGGVPDYLVETYAPDAEMPPRLTGAPGYAHSIHVPGDEMSLHLFEGLSLEEVRDALAQAEVTYARIVEARQ